MRQAGWLCVLALFLGLGGCTTAWYSAYQRQKESEEALRPRAPEQPAAAGTLTPVRVRVWADDGFRSQNVDWQGQVRRQIERANQILAAEGVELVLAEARPWSRATGTSLEDDLAALEVYDNAPDVDLVVGMVSALRAFSDAMHLLGMARVLGRHVVLRGMDDTLEYEAISRRLSMLSQERKDALYLERRRHKEAAVLVHEWAHTLGATHSSHSDDYMSSTYSTEQRAFSPETSEVLRAALENPARWRDPAAQRAWLLALRQVLERRGSALGVDGEALRSHLDGILGKGEGEREGDPVAAAPPPPRPAGQPLRIAEEAETASCRVLGMTQVTVSAGGDLDHAMQKAEAELEARAQSAGADTLTTSRAEKAGKTYVFATLYRCGP